MTVTRQLMCITLALTGLLSLPCWAQAPNTSASPDTGCAALASVDFSGIQDAPTQIVDAKLTEASDGQPAYCQIQGYIWPQVGFEVRLPISHWNGKFFELGCGGRCGTFAWMMWCPLQRGYACIASDMGHSGKNQDMLWAYNNLQALIDFDTRGAHVAALAGKAITEHYYSKAPDKAYFIGCSNGGLQALVEAQRFPWDFNGIISLDGVPNLSDIDMEQVWGARTLRGEDGHALLTHQELQLVHNAALASCDMDDGVKDGVISDPYQCKFDPSELICKSGVKTACLSEAQVDAVKKIYAGPTTRKGEKLSYIRGPTPGSELGWIDDNVGMDYIHSGSGLGGSEEWVLEAFRYADFTPAPGPHWKLTDFDFDRDYTRLGVSETLWDASNPDLRKFKGAGGKLIVAQGWNDQSVVPAVNIGYYQLAEKTMGGRAATQEFFRLFVVPGMEHCTGGAGAFAIDYVSYLEKWVENGQAPDKLVGAHVDEQYLLQHSVIDGQQYGAWIGALQLKFPLDPAIPVTFTRPIYPYPVLAKYRGTGDPSRAENFHAVGP